MFLGENATKEDNAFAKKSPRSCQLTWPSVRQTRGEASGVDSSYFHRSAALVDGRNGASFSNTAQGLQAGSAAHTPSGPRVGHPNCQDVFPAPLLAATSGTTKALTRKRLKSISRTVFARKRAGTAKTAATCRKLCSPVPVCAPLLPRHCPKVPAYCPQISSLVPKLRLRH